LVSPAPKRLPDWQQLPSSDVHPAQGWQQQLRGLFFGGISYSFSSTGGCGFKTER
jgi:hypothetical protein